MEHRCLYGHRIPTEFSFAIQERTCPVCGAATVSMESYHLARTLTSDVPMEALEAFRIVQLIEDSYVLVPREDPEDEVAIESPEDLAGDMPEPEFAEEVRVQVNGRAGETHSGSVSDDSETFTSSP